MEIKKSDKANLEQKKGFYTQIGLVCTLLVMLIAINWKSYDQTKEAATQRLAKSEVEVMAPITQAPPPPPPKLPPPPPPAVLAPASGIKTVDDSKKVDDNINFGRDNDVDTAKPVDIPPPPEDTLETTQEVFQIVEKNPGFPGGDQARVDFLSKNLKYPAVAMESGTQGTVWVSFVVERDGSITQVKILRGIGDACDKEAMRVVRMMPNWSPGEQRHKPVRVAYRIPIKFNLGS